MAYARHVYVMSIFVMSAHRFQSHSDGQLLTVKPLHLNQELSALQCVQAETHHLAIQTTMGASWMQRLLTALCEYIAIASLMCTS